MNTNLENIILSLEYEQLELPVGTESFKQVLANLTRMAKFTVQDSLVSKFITRVIMKRVETVANLSTLGVIAETEYKKLSNIKLVGPEDLVASYLEYGEVIEASITQLQTIDVDCILPICEYLESVVTGRAKKLFDLSKITLPDLNKLKEAYKKLWDTENRVKRLGSNNTNFGRLYPLKEHFSLCGELSSRLDKLLNNFNFKRFSNLEERLLETAKIFNSNRDTLEFETEKIKHVIVLMRGINESLEFLAAMILESQRYITLYNSHQVDIKRGTL